MALNPNPSLLDPGQIAKRSFDGDNDRIRVDANITAPDGSSILIDATTDSIKIGNTATGPFLDVQPDGSINVNATVTSAPDPSIGVNGDPIPTSSTQAGAKDPSGDLQPLKVDAFGNLRVTATSIFTTQDVKVLFNEVAAIAIGTETVINTYTGPIGKIAYLLSLYNSGENRGQFNIYLNGTLFDKQYTNVAQLSATFDYKTGSGTVPGMVISAGDVVQVKAVNNGTSTASYNSRFLILEVT